MKIVTGAGRRVGPYELIETAYTGSSSVVYRCRDESAREVAVKAVRRDCAEPSFARQRAQREARVRRLVADARVLELLRVVPAEDGPLLVAPWLEGGSLRDRRPPLPLDDALALADGIGGALDALHATGWWHGDVAPANVLFGPDGPVLADLGSVRRIGARAVRRGTLVVTPQVCAPEVWAGLAADGRADVYGLGALLYWALTGVWPFDAIEPAALAELHRRAVVPRPSTRTPAVGAAVESVLLRALAKAPAERYATGPELAARLRDAAHADGADSSYTPRAADSAFVAAGKNLDRFAETLDGDERRALRRLLRRSAAAAARASDETEQLAMQVFAPAAALLALEDCGAAAALAAGNESAADVAAACGAREESISRLFELLAATGLLARNGGRYRLPPALGMLYAAEAQTGHRARPLRDAAAFWAHLSEWAATGEPGPEMDSSDGACYARAAARTQFLEAEPARELAQTLLLRGLVSPHAHVLDVGAGSAVWGLAVAASTADVHLTALDRPLVLDVARVNADLAGLAGRFHTLAGDWHEIPLPPSSFDLAVLANICHLEPEDQVKRLLRRVAAALQPRAGVVVVDTMLDPETADLGALMQSLHLALRTPGGRLHDAGGYASWLREAGFRSVETIPLETTAGRLSALVAARG